jgi:hypothetical protein
MSYVTPVEKYNVPLPPPAAAPPGAGGSAEHEKRRINGRAKNDRISDR